MSGEAASRQEERKKKPLQIFKALGIGIAEGVIITGLSICHFCFTCVMVGCRLDINIFY
ncbi:MAG: hypothetical protein ACTSPT_10055 [Candidatus Heimdallarchaeota archaeon]